MCENSLFREEMSCRRGTWLLAVEIIEYGYVFMWQFDWTDYTYVYILMYTELVGENCVQE